MTCATDNAFGLGSLSCLLILRPFDVLLKSTFAPICKSPHPLALSLSSFVPFLLLVLRTQHSTGVKGCFHCRTFPQSFPALPCPSFRHIALTARCRVVCTLHRVVLIITPCVRLQLGSLSLMSSPRDSLLLYHRPAHCPTRMSCVSVSGLIHTLPTLPPVCRLPFTSSLVLTDPGSDSQDSHGLTDIPYC